MLQTLLDSCAALGVPLTAAQAEQLCDFGARLLEQNRVMNLTAITEPQAVAKLHFADCLALLRIVPFSGKRVIDVGCGAGFPGVPLKLGEPSLDLTLLDSLGKRVTWLEATLRDIQEAFHLCGLKNEKFSLDFMKIKRIMQSTNR